MNNPYIAAILAVTSLSFSDATFLHDKVEYEHKSVDRHKINDYKPDKKNCDLCVNSPRKRKTIQV